MDDALKKYLAGLDEKKLMVNDNRILANDLYKVNAKRHLETRIKNGWAEKNANAHASAEVAERRRQGVLKSQTPESKAKRAKSMQKPLMTPDGLFESVKAAGEFYADKWEIGIQGARKRLYKLIKAKNAGFVYIEK